MLRVRLSDRNDQRHVVVRATDASALPTHSRSSWGPRLGERLEAWGSSKLHFPRLDGSCLIPLSYFLLQYEVAPINLYNV